MRHEVMIKTSLLPFIASSIFRVIFFYLQEKALEHWGAARRGDKKSHMFKHQCNEHAGEPPNFLFKVVSKHRTALGRQVKEAVRIRRRDKHPQLQE